MSAIDYVVAVGDWPKGVYNEKSGEKQENHILCPI